MAGGQNIPAVGFGTYLIEDEKVSNLVEQAISLGYRHIDTAEIYANEAGVGQGIRCAVADCGLTRQDIFVTTKMWPGHEAWNQPAKTYQSTLRALDESLARLKLEYVDLYLIHAPLQPDLRLDQWRAMLELQQQGKARAIGVSNYGPTHLNEIEASGMAMPAVNQIELHPWSQKPELVSHLRQRDIAIVAYSSLAPLANWRDGAGETGARVEHRKALEETGDAPFRTLADKYGVTEPQLLLRWGLQRGFGVLPKSTHPARIGQNFELFGFAIDEPDMARISAMDRGNGLAWGLDDPTLKP